MILRFDQSDTLKVSFGRYHTPINYWNTAFHHGQWLQTTIARPEMIQFGGRLLPVHFVGALVEGSVPAGGWNLNYKAGVGNGRATVISRGGDAGDVNDHRAWLVNAFSKPDRLLWSRVRRLGVRRQGDHDRRRRSTNRSSRRMPRGRRRIPRSSPRSPRPARGGTAGSRPGVTPTTCRAPIGCRSSTVSGSRTVRFEHVGVDAADRRLSDRPAARRHHRRRALRRLAVAALKGEYRTWTRGENSVRNHGGFFQVCFTF